jgi:acyl transferase domain-containing protein/thioesterase domain-containing protein/acyl carrier protein
MSDEKKILDSLKRVTIELRGTRERLREVEERAAEPIAIVGMSCRFPGGITSPDELWQRLAAGADGISEFPADRNWPLDRLFDPDPDHPGTSYAREGGFVDATGFDAGFFGIGPREARAMDPQQRLLMEATWEAFEGAGIEPAAVTGRPVGVFAGMMYHDYGWGTSEEADVEGYYGFGKAGSVLSGRLAYWYGLEGPAVTVDTACSSSLVAMHLAAGALRAGECELALAGGVSTLGTPGSFVELSRQRGLAPDGRCKPFDAAADGMSMSEGCGLLLLERLSDARRHGRRVLAVVRGSAVNQDGASNGLTAPNGPSQERVIRQALAHSGLAPAEVDAVEAHGTGTPLGDPIEAQALLATYGQARGDGSPLLLGSVKSNLGHTQAAAGAAGVIKMVQALRHQQLPRTIHLEEPTPHVDWSAGEIELLREERAWERGERPRRAGVSSFGVSGTNAHLILEEAPASEPAAEPLAEPPLSPLLLSAKDDGALRELGGRLAAHLRSHPDQGLAEVAATLAASRARLPRRAAAIGADREEAIAALVALGQGTPHKALLEGRAQGSKPAFLFPGQGPQWLGMGRELLEGSEVFAERIDECEEALAPHISFSLRDVLTGKAESEAVEVIQPALFATMVALTELWRVNGVEPAAVLGHSQGEIAAACVAGALTLEDAARVVALRSGILARRLAGSGGMVSVHLPVAAAGELIGPWGKRLSVAAINSPTATVIAGGNEALDELLESCAEAGVPARRLALDCPSHSAEVEPTREELLAELAPISPRPGRIPVYSAMTAAPIAGEEMGPEYWYASMREPVRFHPAVSRLLADGFSTFVEASAHPVLIPAVIECAAAEEREVGAVASLRREEGSPQRFAAALAEAHLAGAEPDWRSYFGERAGAPLPTYPFQRSRYWLDGKGPGASDPAAIGQSDPEHPFLASLVALPNEEGWLATGRVSLREHPWLADHVLMGHAVMPGTGFLELALKAAEIAGAAAVAELAIEAPLVLAEEGALALQLRIGAADDRGNRPLEIHSRPDSDPDGEWVRHASGSLSAVPPAATEPLAAWPPPGSEQIDVGEFYDRAAEVGIDYGPAFQGLRSAYRRGEELFAAVELGPEAEQGSGGFLVHPALLDAAVQTGMLGGAEAGELRVPFSWQGVRLERSGPTALRVRLATAGEGAAMTLATAGGEPVASIGALAARRIDPAALRAVGGGPSPALYRVRWDEVTLPPATEREGAPEPVRLHPDPDLDLPAAARALCEQALAALQEAIAAEDEGGPVAFLSEGAVAAIEGEAPDPALAAAWGLVRSAQAEHPGRFFLIDSDGSEASAAEIPAALHIRGEDQIALRDGKAVVPRLAVAPETGEKAPAYDPEGTIVITGGTGTLGSLLARHLAAGQGARHLVLTSRRGPAAPGARELVAELAELGAEAEVRACDVSERSQLEDLLASVPAEHPPVAVLHCAGDTDDGLVDSLDPERLANAMAPKADGAWALHELTREIPGCELVLFSSVAGTLQSPGQGNYAAANAFLDALAQRRAAEGLAGVSVGWGSWATRSEITGKLSAADEARISRGGVLDLEDADGLDLHERSRALADAAVLAVTIDKQALRSAARLGAMPPIFRGLVRAPARRAAGGSLAERLAAVPESEREPVALELVRSHVAVVLGHASSEAVDPAVAFKDLGFDSLSAVELRNRLAAATGLQLPATLVFDHPSAEAVARYLVERAGGVSTPAPQISVRSSLDPDEPIAIVGMSCRYPGGADSPEALWQLLRDGADAIGRFPEDRGWEVESPDLEGGFVADATGFDASFFGLHPLEARSTDPQQRLLLETSWQTLEDAGIDPAELRGSPTGVYAGVMYQDYGAAVAEMAGTEDVPMGGMGGSLISGRVAYSFGFEGPAVTVDTACSSSLVAMHLAAQALRAGDCELALAGGVTVLATPMLLTAMARQGGLAGDGRCKSFDAAGDGIGISEGVGLVLLERLADAERNGHRVLALLRGSATNQDGASNGITAPNGPSQERVIRQALANAGLAPAEVDAVEAHGTGTPLGDPIEAQALLATYGQEREEGRPLALGSIKSNLGHTQAAAGVAGVIKMVQALRHGELPRTIHLTEPNPHVDWSSGRVELLASERPWERNGRPRRAAVSSFGISGTNAHLILEEAPAAAAPAAAEGLSEPPPAVPLVLSARSEEALREGAERLRGFLAAHPEVDTAQVARSLASDRPLLERRAALAAEDREGLEEALASLAAGAEDERAFLAPAAATAAAGPGPVFLFPGQGAQWRRMALGLLDSSPLFAAAIDECEQALEPHVGWSLRALLRCEEGAADLERIEVVQPALFAMMVALARLWRASGVEPAAVLGHSQGEIAAAHVAGGLSLDDAARLVARRSQVLAKGTGWGAMALVAAGEDALDARVPGWREAVHVGGVNSRELLVLSGENEGIDETLARCEEAGIWSRRVRAAVGPGHSPVIERGREMLLEAATGISPRTSEVPFYSSVSAEPLDTAGLDADYWYRNARQTVLYGPAIERLLGDGCRRFVEVSPNPILLIPTLQTFAAALGEEAASASFTGTLRRKHGGGDDFALALGSAWANGVAVDWERALPDPGGERIDLPTYAFQRERFWGNPASRGSGDASASGQEPAGHPLLAAAIPAAGDESWTFTGRISAETHPWIADHGGMGVVLVPGTAFAELALHAGARVGLDLLRELSLEAPLLLPEGEAAQVQLSLSAPAADGSRSVALHSRPQEAPPGGGWTRHAGGVLGRAEADVAAAAEEWPPAGAEPLEVEEFYDRIAALGIEYGPALQGLRAAWRRDETVFVEVELGGPEAETAERFGLHPALFDAALHSSGLFFLGSEAEAGGPRLPFAFTDVRLGHRGLASLRAALEVGEDGSISVRASGPDGQPALAVGSMVTRPLPSSYLAAAAGAADAAFSLDWAPVELAPAEDDPQGPPAAVHRVPPDAEATDPAAAAHAAAAAALAAAQRHLAEPGEGGARLVFVTAGAIAAAAGDEVPNPGQAAVWGLIRSAQIEHPGRFGLVDLDGSEAAEGRLDAALASAEPQLALRGGGALAARLRRASLAPAESPPAIDPDGTLLVTGGTGDLGGLTARHLVARHGIRAVLLASRSGEEAPGAAELRAALEELGAEVEVAACDVGDREQLEALLASIDPERPLTAVVHTAVALDDGVLTELTPERLDTVLAPKADAAWHLHELTAGAELGAFVLFSSLAGTIGNPGQANYAAANGFLDSLAAHRSALGLPATAIAWGLWERTMKRGEEELGERDLARAMALGLAPIPDELGLELLDAALTSGRPATVAARLNLAVWRLQAPAIGLPPVLSELVPATGIRPASAQESLPRLLAAAAEEEREGVALDFVRRCLADALGFESAQEIDPERPFLELGFDSLTALQFRNVLNGATGLDLSPSVALDHPTPAALAAHVLAQMEEPAEGGGAAGAGQTLTTLLREAHAEDRAVEFLEVVAEMASFRPRFPAAGQLEPFSLRLADGLERPPLVCVPSAAPVSGPHEYARLAHALGDRRPVHALRWPGFAAGELLPAGVEAAIELQVEALRALGAERPVLLGHSTGGALAYAIAERLEEAGEGPAAVVMVDSYHPRQLGFDAPAGSRATHAIGLGVLGDLLALEGSGAAFDDARLTAMAAYLKLVFELEPAPLAAPVLLLRAAEPIGGGDPGEDWQPSWEVPHEGIEVPGNHLSMMDALAPQTAAAIAEWLAESVGEARIGQTEQGVR